MGTDSVVKWSDNLEQFLFYFLMKWKKTIKDNKKHFYSQITCKTNTKINKQITAKYNNLLKLNF